MSKYGYSDRSGLCIYGGFTTRYCSLDNHRLVMQFDNIFFTLNKKTSAMFQAKKHFYVCILHKLNVTNPTKATQKILLYQYRATTPFGSIIYLQSRKTFPF